MTRTCYTLDDLGGGLSERALLSFTRRLPADSETVAELWPEDGGWSRADMLLARLCEDVEWLTWVISCRGRRRSSAPPHPKRIPRPGVKPDERRIGRGPIPISEFDTWYYGGGDS